MYAAVGTIYLFRPALTGVIIGAQTVSIREMGGIPLLVAFLNSD
jgi:hypothetical protein